MFFGKEAAYRLFDSNCRSLLRLYVGLKAFDTDLVWVELIVEGRGEVLRFRP